MASSVVRAGSLVWDLEIGKQEDVLRKVQDLGRKLDDALNKPRNAGKSPLDGVGEEADRAANRVTEFAREFTRLNVQLKSGQITATQYGTSLRTLQTTLTATARATNLNAAEYKTLNTLIPQVNRAQATLGGTTADVVAKTRELAGEIRRLRNDWQHTGQATEETKRRLAELANETARYAAELKAADGGTKRFGAQLDQLAVAGRSAQATIDGMEGRMSRLGLASQVNLAVQQQMVSQLSAYGPAGRIAAGSLGLVGGGMGVVGTGALVATGGLLAVGAAGAALMRTGIPEVKAMQAALNVLIASGEELDSVGLDRILRDAQEAAGSAGRQFARGDIATALAEIVKAGVPAAEAIELLAPGMQLAVVTGQDLNQATSNLLANLRQFGLETTEAGRAADALAAADLAAAHGAAELSEGLATVGPVARAAGMTLEDTLGILVELDNKGLDPADKGATALRGTLSALLDPTAKATGVLESLGIQLRDGEGKARPLLTILNELQEALNGSSEAAQEAAQIFDTRAVTAILNMTNASSANADALRDSEGAAKAYADQVTRDDLQKAQDALVVAWKDLAGTFSSQFSSGLTSATNTIANFLRDVDAFFQAGGLAKLLALQNLFGLNPISDDLQARMDAFGVPKGSGGRSGDVTGVWGGPDFSNPGQQFGPQRGTNPPPGTVATPLGWYIAEATRLKKALDAAKDPQSWMAAQAAVEAFRKSSDTAAQAWQAVVATLGGASGKAAKPERSVQGVFDDLAKSGKDAEQRALAFGDTLDARIASADARAKLVNAAINELINDLGLDAMDAQVQYLVARLVELEAETAELKAAAKPVTLGVKPTASIAQGWQDGQRALKAYESSLAALNSREALGLVDNQAKLTGELQATQTAINALAPIYDDLTSDQQAALQTLIQSSRELEAELAKLEQQAGRVQRQRERAIQTQLERDDDNATAEGGMTLAEWRADRARRQAEADAKAKEQAAAAAEAAKQAQLRANQLRQEELNVRAQAHTIGLQIMQYVKAGSVEGLQELEATILALLEQYADTALGPIFAGLLTELRAGEAELEAKIAEEARLAQEKADRLILNARRAQTLGIQRDAQALGAQVATAIRQGSIEGLEGLEAELVAKINELGDDPIAALYMGVLTELRAGHDALLDEASTTIETLQWKLLELRNQGFEPTSEAVQTLVRRINELQLKAALDELRTKGVKNLSAFARAVLEANGVLPKAVGETRNLVDGLRALGGNDIAAGLADVVDGIKAIAEAGGDAEKVVAGLTTVLQGAAKLAQGMSDGDAFSVVKNTASIIGEGIGMAAGVPGVGQAVAAAFDLGKVIVDSISDAFTGDSPAARAIRDGLSTAVQSAFTTGILAALQQGENWRENLSDGVRMAFLTGLIEAFIKSAIITAIIEPILFKYSKMLAAGQYAAAADFLAGALPAAMDKAMSQVDQFVSSIPAGLIPTTSPNGGSEGNQSPTGLFELPTAAVTAIAAPDWARDLVTAGRMQVEAAAAFAAAVDLLRSEGITVKTTTGASSSSGGSAAAARAA